jgi:hypothetical protein
MSVASEAKTKKWISKHINHISELCEQTQSNLVEVVNSKKIIVICNECGITRTTTYHNMKQGKACKCVGWKKHKSIMLEKYGVENGFQSESIKGKIKDTNLKKRGVEFSTQCEKVKSKMRKTLKENHGVDCVGLLNDRVKKAMVEKYGVDNAFRLEKFKEKAKRTCLNKYGVENYKQKHLSQEVLEILNNPNKMYELIEKIKETTNKKPTRKELATAIGITEATHSTLCEKINDMGLADQLSGKNHSSNEKEIADMFRLQSQRFSWGYEIDGYDSTTLIGIEYNGCFWHSTKYKPQDYHDKKSRTAQENGIRIIHIWDYEWHNRREQCIKLISNALNRNITKIYARKCTVDESVSAKEYNAFMEREHIQGTSQAGIRLGLRYKKQLVMCCGLRKENDGYNLVRMASSCNVVGGASRLAKHFPETSIVTFCDTGKFTGVVYEKMGFIKDGETKPRYVWVKGNTFEVRSRRACQKQYICEKPEDWLKTERELMSEKGYCQCYGNHMDRYVRKL